MIASLAKSGRSPPLLNALNDSFPISLKMLPALPCVESRITACFLTPKSPFRLSSEENKVPEWHGTEVQVGGTRGETYPNASDSRTGGAALPRNPESQPGLCRVRGSSLSYGSRFLKTSWSRFLTHTYTHHTQVRERPLLESWSFPNQRGRWLSAIRVRARRRGEHRAAPDLAGGLEKAPCAGHGQPEHPLSPPTPAPVRPPRRLL